MANVLFEKQFGVSTRPKGPGLDKIGLKEPVARALLAWFGENFQLSPPQSWAIENGLLEGDKHFFVSAPTNSGKTLIAFLRIFHRAQSTGKRFIYVVPLKALAEEKAEEIEQISALIQEHGGRIQKATKSTGDYQLSSDFMGSPPEDKTELMICTPERLEIIARNPENLAWLRSVDTFVFDEFHLLGERGRGAAMECLLTRVLTLCPDAVAVALSATVGNAKELCDWLSHTGKPVELLESDFRYPVLSNQLLQVENKDEHLVSAVTDILRKQNQNVLIFVYRKADAEKLAKLLGEASGLGEKVGFFHAGVALAKRSQIANQFNSGQLRVLVTTSSLKMGINTPATHVFVRDTVYMGNGRVTTADLLQMVGRAGRGETPGHGCVLFAPAESVEPYLTQLRSGDVDEIKPQLIPPKSNDWRRGKADQSKSEIDDIIAAILSEIARHDQIATGQMTEFFTHTYSCWKNGGNSPDTSQALASLQRGKLIFKVENSESSYAATKLGRTAAQTGLSPESAAMLAGFIRALIKLSQKKEEADGKTHNYLKRLSDLDFLFLAVASFESRQYIPGRLAKSKVEDLTAFVEQLDPEEKPLLNLWRSADSSEYPTRRLLSSLRLEVSDDDRKNELMYYCILSRAVLLYRHSKGMPLADLAREYGVHAGTLESGLKFTVTWVLHCLSQICTPDRCYNLRFISFQLYELIENQTFGSTLGKLMTVKGVGRRSVQRLINSGIESFVQLKELEVGDLQQLGIKKAQSKKIVVAARRGTR